MGSGERWAWTQASYRLEKKMSAEVDTFVTTKEKHIMCGTAKPFQEANQQADPTGSPRWRT
jgi:hypothetical protein